MKQNFVALGLCSIMINEVISCKKLTTRTFWMCHQERSMYQLSLSWYLQFFYMHYLVIICKLMLKVWMYCILRSSKRWTHSIWYIFRSFNEEIYWIAPKFTSGCSRSQCGFWVPWCSKEKNLWHNKCFRRHRNLRKKIKK